MHSPSETGTTRRQLRGRGRSWETGASRGCLALAVGRRAGQAGKLASLVRQAKPGKLGNWSAWCGKPSKAPSIP
jgi:hypothetical protein